MTNDWFGDGNATPTKENDKFGDVPVEEKAEEQSETVEEKKPQGRPKLRGETEPRGRMIAISYKTYPIYLKICMYAESMKISWSRAFFDLAEIGLDVIESADKDVDLSKL